jgi:DNA-binding transcriptional ArsR family regulator
MTGVLPVGAVAAVLTCTYYYTRIGRPDRTYGGAQGLLIQMLDLKLPPITVRVHLPFVITDQSAALTALGDHTRRAIVVCLAERPRAVGELADELPVSRPAVSQHLKVLKDAGLVTDRAVGTRRIYRLNPAGIGALRDQLETFWNRALASYKDVVEESREESS